MVQPGDDLPALIADGFARAGEAVAEGDVLVVAQKIVSKSEGRYADLATVEPGAEARELAARTAKDPRMVELILSESRRVVRHRPGVIIVEHRLGFVMANAGIDNSNVEPAGTDERVLLLPRDPDGSARRIREGLRERLGADCAVIVNDSVGRAWRVGTVGLALGAAGLPSLLDLGARRSLRPPAGGHPGGARGRARRRRLAAPGRGRRGYAGGGGARSRRRRAGERRRRPHPRRGR